MKHSRSCNPEIISFIDRLADTGNHNPMGVMDSLYEEQGDDATAVLYRRMSEQSDPALYELRLRKVDGQWPVPGETVLPWPDLSMARSFLPPRTK